MRPRDHHHKTSRDSFVGTNWSSRNFLKKWTPQALCAEFDRHLQMTRRVRHNLQSLDTRRVLSGASLGCLLHVRHVWHMTRFSLQTGTSTICFRTRFEMRSWQKVSSHQQILSTIFPRQVPLHSSYFVCFGVLPKFLCWMTGRCTKFGWLFRNIVNQSSSPWTVGGKEGWGCGDWGEGDLDDTIKRPKLKLLNAGASINNQSITWKNISKAKITKQKKTKTKYIKKNKKINKNKTHKNNTKTQKKNTNKSRKQNKQKHNNTNHKRKIEKMMPEKTPIRGSAVEFHSYFRSVII